MWKTKPKENFFVFRLDGIGDYVLFRNFFPVIKQQNGRLTFCGSSAYKDLAEKLDGSIVDHFIWVDTLKFSRSRIYRFLKLLQIRMNQYSVAIFPVHTRNYYFGDDIARMVSAHKKIATLGSGENTSTAHYQKGNGFYSDLIDCSASGTFEFYKSRYFIEQIFGLRLPLMKPEINGFIKPDKTVGNVKKILIFIGASHEYKKWSPYLVKKLCDLVHGIKNVEITIDGGKEDIHASNLIVSGNSEIKNLTGKTTLLDLCETIAVSDIIITNDTGVLHISAAMTASVVCLATGENLGRYTPYPKEVSENLYFIFPEYVYKDDSLTDLKQKEDIGPWQKDSINTISPERVLETIKKLL